MAIAFVTANQGKGGGGVNTVNVAITVSGTDTILVAGVINQNNGTITSVQYAGVNMTLIDTQSDASVTNVRLYYLVNPSAGANNLTVVRGTTTNTLYVHGAVYSGAKQSAQPDASTKGANPGGTSMTGTLSTVADNSWTVITVYSGNGGTSAGSGSTLRGSVQDTATAIFDSNGPKTPAGSTSMTVNSALASNNAAYVMASFAPAVAVATSSRLTLLGVS